MIGISQDAKFSSLLHFLILTSSFSEASNNSISVIFTGTPTAMVELRLRPPRSGARLSPSSLAVFINAFFIGLSILIRLLSARWVGALSCGTGFSSEITNIDDDLTRGEESGTTVTVGSFFCDSTKFMTSGLLSDLEYSELEVSPMSGADFLRLISNVS